MLNVEKIRQDFPILNRVVHGKPLVYLDNAATTHKPESVLLSEKRFYETQNANIHRGIHTLSEEATRSYEDARAKIARFIGASQTESVIFTRNTTEAINLVAFSWARKFLKAGDGIILSVYEHHSNLIPWQQVAAQTGAKLRFVPLTESGHFDLAAFEKMLSKKTKLVALSAMSNVLGTILPVQKVAELVDRVGAKFLLDGAQSVPHLPTRVTDLKCDFLAFSAHKMLGPTGIGVLWGKPELLDEMDPFMGGGDMILEVWREKATWNELPWKFEAGTPNVAGAIAFGAAIDYLNQVGMDAVRAHDEMLTTYALKRFAEDPQIKIYGPKDMTARGGVISFNYGTIHPHDIGTLLDQEGIAIRAGHHCAQPLMRDYGISGTARASFYLYNTTAEVDALVTALSKVATVFHSV